MATNHHGVSEVIPGVWRIRDRKATSYIVKLSPGAVIVDTGMDTTGRPIMMGLQTVRVGLSSVRAILLTSVEPGAAGGIEALAKRSGAPAFGPRADKTLRLVRPGQILAEHFLAVGIPGAAESIAYYFQPARALFGTAPGSELTAGLDVERVLGR